MGMPFATRNPSALEVERLRLFLSTFRDGSGSEREPDGTTRAGWRQMERCFAELVGASGGENKAIFDVVAIDDTNPKIAYGLSIKSKALSANNFARLNSGARVYMEIANSPAKFLDVVLDQHGLTLTEFKKMLHAGKFGTSVIDTVHSWHQAGKGMYEAENPGVVLDLNKSCYVCLSYSDAADPDLRDYRVDAFPLDYPANVQWKFYSAKCLRGYDPAYPQEALLDWYAASGGQLKYYPRATAARFSTPVFRLEAASSKTTIASRAMEMFPKLYK